MLEKESTNLLEVKEKWEEIASHSALGTLARSEAEFILEMIEILESENGKDISEINLKDLEAVSGGALNKGNKTLASMLASVLAFSAVPGASAVIPSAPPLPANSGDAKMPDAATKAKFKQVAEDAATAANKAYFSKKVVPDVKLAGEVRDDGVAQLDMESAAGELNSEILKFCQKIGKGQFHAPFWKINEVTSDKTHQKNVLPYIKETNRILEKYSAATKTLIEYHKKRKTLFYMALYSPPADRSGLKGHFNMHEVAFYAPKVSYFRTLIDSYNYHLNNYVSSVSIKKLNASIAAHEMGHLIQRLSWLDCRYYDITLEEFAEQQSKKIKEIAKTRYGCKDFSISKYGDSDPIEWFAEVFAHMECSDEDQLNPLGKAMRDYLQTTPYGVKN